MKLIDKDSLVAKIRKRLLPVIRDKHYDEWEEGQDNERIAILGIINTLEVKGVDLDFENELYKAFGQVKDFTLVCVLLSISLNLGLKHRKENRNESGNRR